MLNCIMKQIRKFLEYEKKCIMVAVVVKTIGDFVTEKPLFRYVKTLRHIPKKIEIVFVNELGGQTL